MEGAPEMAHDHVRVVHDEAAEAERERERDQLVPRERAVRYGNSQKVNLHGNPRGGGK